MDADDTTTASSPNGTKFAPPYFPFRALVSAVERMEREGLPHQIDKTYVSNLPWGYQNHFLGTLKTFGLTDDAGRPTDALKRLAKEPQNRPALWAEILRANYPDVVALPDNATQQQLENEFKKFEISGDTLRKAISFYLNAAKEADVSTSPHFKTPRASPSGRRSAKRAVAPEPTPTPPQPTPPSGIPGASDLHPFILGLLKELPATDGTGTWTSAKHDAWLDIARQTVDMLIRVEDPVPATKGEDD